MSLPHLEHTTRPARHRRSPSCLVRLRQEEPRMDKHSVGDHCYESISHDLGTCVRQVPLENLQNIFALGHV